MTSKDGLRERVENALRSKLWLTQVTDTTAPEHWQFYLTESGDLVAVDINEATDAILNLLEGEKQKAVEQWWRGRVIPYAHDGKVDLEHFRVELATLNKEPNKGEDVDEENRN